MHFVIARNFWKSPASFVFPFFWVGDPYVDRNFRLFPPLSFRRSAPSDRTRHILPHIPSAPTKSRHRRAAHTESGPETIKRARIPREAPNNASNGHVCHRKKKKIVKSKRTDRPARKTTERCRPPFERWKAVGRQLEGGWKPDGRRLEGGWKADATRMQPALAVPECREEREGIRSRNPKEKFTET